MTPEQQAAATLLLSSEGWAHASSASVTADDPGRFNALFGRDSLIFGLQLLPARPEVAGATLRALADLQGRVHDPETEEEPGRILHEYRPVAPAWLVEQGWPVRENAIRYYGSSDATSWFLVVLAATDDARLCEDLAAHRSAAAEWLAGALERGGGLLRCGPRRFSGGLAQQGWRDSLDPTGDENGGGIVREDGSMPSAPFADLDSQAVAVAALDALVRLDPGGAPRWRELAASLRRRIAERFDPDTIGYDAADSPVTGAGSHLGWLLWANVLDRDLAEVAAGRLLQPDVLTPYGLRTLSSDHPAFRETGYHRGAVWPFDNWICWGGLRRCGRMEEAEQVRSGVRRALTELRRYPELYAVTSAGQLRPIAVANRVQAWTLGTAVAFDHDWAGIEPSTPGG